MRPTIKKQKIAYFSPQGFLDGNNASQLITMQDMQAVRVSNVSMVLVSLKKVVFFNKNGISIVLDALEKIQKELKVTIGFCDYTRKQYEAFFKFFEGDIGFSLFKTLDVAMLFAGVNEAQEGDESVLIYNEDPTQRSMQAIEVFDKGYNPVVVQTLDDFTVRAEDKEKFVAIVERTYLGLMSNRIAAKTRGNCVIYYLKGFLDGSVTEQFDVIYHQNCLKVGFQLFMFDATRVSSLNIHAANFFSRLSTAGAEYGALIAIVGLDMEKTPKRFVEELEDAGIMFFENETDFFTDEVVQSMSGGGAAVKKERHKLTKPMVARLPVLVSATMDTLQMMTGMMALKEDMNIQPFKHKGKELMASSIAFFGDIEGMITLVMPRELVRKSCALLVGEESDDTVVLADALSELVNIVAGKSKTQLQEQGVNIDITLPRSYTSIDDLERTLEGVQGVQVNFSFEEYPFTFYLSP
ncbi:chemotaxis protein CheX [Hydrogenimonas urashimensis]|uniref:chemotaxis protein CheX n=1 Tax=Hydrogenimonas urashimensis TaxID=2740515 RepID=UPI0019160E21|nr:chemotaxis protein CheX [Hydrogenimonas urashimensis]